MNSNSKLRHLEDAMTCLSCHTSVSATNLLSNSAIAKKLYKAVELLPVSDKDYENSFTHRVYTIYVSEIG